MPEVLATAQRTTTGSQEITTNGNPAAVLSIMSAGVTNDTLAADAALSIGFSDGTNQRLMSVKAEDSQATSDANRYSNTSQFAGVGPDNTGAMLSNISMTSLGTNKFTINVDTTDAVAYQMLNLVFTTDEVANVFVGTTSASGGTTDVTAPGFEPDIVFFTTIGATTQGAFNHAIFNFGVCINDGTPTQKGASWSSRDAQGTSVTSMKLHSATTGGQVYNGAEAWAATISAFDSSGFTISDTTADLVNYMAIKFANATPSMALFNVTTPSGTDAYAETTPGFTPDFGMLALIDVQFVDSLTTSRDYMSLCMFDGTTTRSISIADDAGQTNTDTDSIIATSWYAYRQGAVSIDQNFSAFDSLGWDFTYVANPPSDRVAFGLALADLTAAGGGFQPAWAVNSTVTL